MNHQMVGSELSAREAVRDLLARYTWAGDRGRSDDLAACFLEDGVLDVGEHGGRWEGREEIRRQIDAVARRAAAEGAAGPVQHQVSSVLIDLLDTTAAEVRSYFCVLTDIGVDHWGTYRDRVELDHADGTWRFASRTVRVLGRAPASRFLPED
ncbi:MAG: nuclear transport factor 2 family protein [Acidimicrobiales bacterium]